MNLIITLLAGFGLASLVISFTLVAMAALSLLDADDDDLADEDDLVTLPMHYRYDDGSSYYPQQRKKTR